MVRIGSPRFDQSGDWDPEKANWGISPRDTAQLFARCVEVEDVDFAIDFEVQPQAFVVGPRNQSQGAGV